MSNQNNTVEMDSVCDMLSNMSTSDNNVCANCGKEGDDITNTCNKCKSVMYCNAACKKKHRHKHKKACEEHLQRVAELHDEKLFKEPPPCFVRLPFLGSGKVYMACCGKAICRGCVYAVQSRAIKEEHDICPFCRTPPAISEEERIKRLEKRADLNDPIAIFNLGGLYTFGMLGIPRDYAKALELWHRAAELGDSSVFSAIGNAYKFGRAVEVDLKQAIHYWELAAMEGEVMARHNLGCVEEKREVNVDRAVKHYMIATRSGYYDSLKCIKRLYSNGLTTKDDYAKALRSYQAYLDEIKSDQREEAAAYNEEYKYYESDF